MGEQSSPRFEHSASGFRTLENLPSMRNFEINNKDSTLESLEGWRKACLVLNASRRFRYTADIQKRREVTEDIQKRKFKIGGLAARAAWRFVDALNLGKSANGGLSTKALQFGFEVDGLQLANMVEGQDRNLLRRHGGVMGLTHKLKTNVQEGLSTEEEDVQQRQDVFGTNTYTEKPPKGFFMFVWEAMHDLTLIILAVCAVVSLGIGIATEGWEEGWYDGAGIGFSILLVVFVTAASDYQQSLQFRDLENEKKKIFIQVTRKCRRQKVSIFDLLVGDIVHLNIGDQVPADGLYISGSPLTIDESSMTGESEPVRKDGGKPFLLSGTKVQDGNALMLVTGVGMNTEWGHLMTTLSESGDDETPLQVKLNGVATLIGKIGLGFAVVTFLVLMLRFLISKDSLTEWSGDDALAIVNYFAIAVTIIVVAVPEGLPLAVTLTLAFAMKKMMSDKALVRHLSACETMGSATTICSDKTGTLTTNKMTVVKAWVAGSVWNADGVKGKLPQGFLQVLLEGIFQNTGGDVADEGDGKPPSLLGSPTETAVLQFGLNLGGNFKDVCCKCDMVKMDPFNSARKRMGVVVKEHHNGQLRAHWKGASEMILELCDKTVDQNGEIVPLDDDKRRELKGVIHNFANDALRTLGLAFKDVERSPGQDEPIPDNGYVLAAIVGIKDPVRDGVKGAVQLCFDAGIKVRMVTGDNIDTAKAIARECGILTDDGDAIEGPEFRNLSPGEMRRRIPNLQVMARSSPSDKHTLVKELRAMGEVVAVTGDGTNDAPALHEADIGLAMGIAGTEVAKESADVVILDDNFSTIVTVAKWGRSVYTNIQKFVQFQLTVNLVALVINFTSACITGEAPLTAVQLLWVNLIMDTLGALALATEPPYDHLMKRPPVGRYGNFISDVIVAKYYWSSMKLNAREMEKINVFRHTFNNWVFLVVIGFTVVFQVILVEFLGKFASTVPLTAEQWLITVSIGAVSLIVAAIVKFIPVSLIKAVHANNGYQPLPGGPSSVEGMLGHCGASILSMPLADSNQGGCFCNVTW